MRPSGVQTLAHFCRTPAPSTRSRWRSWPAQPEDHPPHHHPEILEEGLQLLEVSELAGISEDEPCSLPTVCMMTQWPPG